MEFAVPEWVGNLGLGSLISLVVLLVIRNLPIILDKARELQKQRQEHDRMLIAAGDEQADRRDAANKLLGTSIEILQSVLKKSEERGEAQQQQIAELEKKVMALQAQLEEKNRQIEEMRAQQAEMKKAIEGKQAEIDRLRSELDQVKRQRDDLQGRVKALEEKEAAHGEGKADAKAAA